jgi:hypothetical protein
MALAEIPRVSCEPEFAADLGNVMRPRENGGVFVDGVRIYEARGRALTPYGLGHYTVSDSEVGNGEQFGVLFRGFMGVEGAYNWMRRAWAARGIMTLTFEPMRVRGGSVAKCLRNPELLDVEHVEAALRDIPTNLRVLNKLPNGRHLSLEQMSVALHSYGGVTGTEFISRNRSRVDSAYYMATVGQGSPTALGLVMSTVRHARDEKRDLGSAFESGHMPIDISTAIKLARYVLKDPLRTGAEMARCFTANTTDAIMENRQHNIWHGMFGFEGDALVRGVPGISRIFDHIAVYPDMAHVAPQGQASELSDRMFDARASYPGVA